MIPRWSSRAGNAYGWRVAHWVQAHAKALRVKYIIWDVRNAEPGTPGQRGCAGSGIFDGFSTSITLPSFSSTW